MKLRLVVVAAFSSAALVTGYLAYTTGTLPGPAQAAAGSIGSLSDKATAVTTLAWDDPLGLTAAGSKVFWMQRGDESAGAGLWSYDGATGAVEQELSRSATGKTVGFPSASGTLVVWASWTDGDTRRPRAFAYDSLSTRRWLVADGVRQPAAGGDIVTWIEPGAAGAGHDLIRGSNALTDDQYELAADGKVLDLAAWGHRVVWVSGHGRTGAVWSGSYRTGVRRELATSATSVAADGDHVVWTTANGQSTAIVAWDRRTNRTTVLHRVAGTASSLSVNGRYVAWVSARGEFGSQVWTYDFAAHSASPVSTAGGRQADPVVAANFVYWAWDQGGRWQLYAKSLQP